MGSEKTERYIRDFEDEAAVDRLDPRARDAPAQACVKLLASATANWIETGLSTSDCDIIQELCSPGFRNILCSQETLTETNEMRVFWKWFWIFVTTSLHLLKPQPQDDRRDTEILDQFRVYSGSRVFEMLDLVMTRDFPERRHEEKRILFLILVALYFAVMAIGIEDRTGEVSNRVNEPGL